MTDTTHEDRLRLVGMAAAGVDRLRAELARAEATRDEMIRQAFAAKVPAVDIAARARLHIKRIYQIRREGSAPTPDKKEPTVRYTTRQDAIDQAIAPALDNPDDYDLDAICYAAFDYAVDKDDDGNENLNTAGFEQTVSDEEFWKIVSDHETH